MKKLFFVFLNLFFVLQVDAQKSSETSVFKGNSIITAGYGVGNVWIYFLKNNSLIKDISDYKVTGLGPFDICYEKMISRKVSVGLTAAYSEVKGETKRFLAEEQISIFTALVRANYHFLTSKKLDPYIGGGLGYVRSVYKNSTSVPGPVPGEFGYSAQLGAHYFLTKSLGVYGELGYVNGSFLQLGFAMRIY